MVGSGMVDLICIDVDGTLVGSSGQVPQRVWDAAARLRQLGKRLAVCTGRPAFGVVADYARRLDPEGWHIFQNGASVVQPATGESRSHPLAPPLVQALVARARATNRVLELYGDDEYVVEGPGDRPERHSAALGLPLRRGPLESLRVPIVRAEYLLPPGDLAAVLAEAYPDLCVAASTSPLMADTSFVSFTAGGVSKASAVRWLAAGYGVPLTRVMMVGDSHNDLEALRAVGVPVAMGNADETVRAAALHHVGHVDDGGLAEALSLALAGQTAP